MDTLFEQGSYKDRNNVRQDKKRQRISTGGTSVDDFPDEYDNFVNMSTDEKLVAMFMKISTTEAKVARMYQETLNERLHCVEGVMKTHENRIKLLEYRSIDNEARSRRRNLLFKGICEYGMGENCFELVRDFIADKLSITDDMYLERAHRLGRFKPGSAKPRPIIVAFRDYYDTELILQVAPELKGSQYSVCRDYPHEISEARKQLWPHYRAAREDRSAKVSIRYPARLIVNGITTHDIFPDWFTILKGSRMSSGATEQQSVAQSNGAQRANSSSVSCPPSLNEIPCEQSGGSASYDFVGKEQLTSTNLQFGSEAAFQAPPPVAPAVSSVQTSSSGRSGTDKGLNISNANQIQQNVRREMTNVSVNRTNKDVCDVRDRNVATQPDVTSSAGTRNGTAGTPLRNDVSDVQSRSSSASSHADG
ncbi:MAG: hypothetical protein AB2693_28890 [Candidatus Thiodiazotropha sp.]